MTLSSALEGNELNHPIIEYNTGLNLGSYGIDGLNFTVKCDSSNPDVSEMHFMVHYHVPEDGISNFSLGYVYAMMNEYLSGTYSNPGSIIGFSPIPGISYPATFIIDYILIDET